MMVVCKSSWVFAKLKFVDHKLDTQFLINFNLFKYYNSDLNMYPYLRGFVVYLPGKPLNVQVSTNLGFSPEHIQWAKVRGWPRGSKIYCISSHLLFWDKEGPEGYPNPPWPINLQSHIPISCYRIQYLIWIILIRSNFSVCLKISNFWRYKETFKHFELYYEHLSL